MKNSAIALVLGAGALYLITQRRAPASPTSGGSTPTAEVQALALAQQNASQAQIANQRQADLDAAARLAANFGYSIPQLQAWAKAGTLVSFYEGPWNSAAGDLTPVYQKRGLTMDQVRQVQALLG